jgi:hypothetical protein
MKKLTRAPRALVRDQVQMITRFDNLICRIRNAGRTLLGYRRGGNMEKSFR